MRAFIGYAHRQAAKYGCKGSRLATIKEAITYLKSNDRIIMKTVWDNLPTGDHARFIEDSPNGAKQYQICGRILIVWKFKQIYRKD